MTLSAILLLALLAAYIVALPTWPYSRDWGYGLSSTAGILFMLLMMMVVTGNV